MKSRSTAAILAFLLGPFGVHHFYLDQKAKGFTYLLVTLISLPLCLVIFGFFTIGVIGILCLVDFIRLLVMDDAEFNQKYNGQAPQKNNVDELKKLFELKEAGAISQEEYDKKKAILL